MSRREFPSKGTFVASTQMAEGYDPPSTSLNPPPQWPAGLEAKVREIVRGANRRGPEEDLIVTEILALFAEEIAR